jgi:hypothetical protein
VAVGVGAEDSVGVGVAATCVVALPEGEGDAPVVGDGEAATLQLARRPAAAAPIASPLRRPTRARWRDAVAFMCSAPSSVPTCPRLQCQSDVA